VITKDKAPAPAPETITHRSIIEIKLEEPGVGRLQVDLWAMGCNYEQSLWPSSQVN